jgi:transposase
VTDLEKKLTEEVKTLREENGLLRQKLDLVIRQMLGKKSEQLDPAQLELLLSGLDDQPGKPEASTAPEGLVEATPQKLKSRVKARKIRYPQDLPVEEHLIIPEPVKACPQAWRRIGQEVSEQLDYQPGRFLRQRTIRPKYTRIANPVAPPIIAALPPRLIDGGLASPGLIASILISKYCDHLPLYRQQKIFRERHQVHLPRQTMARWVQAAADWLQPVYQQIQKEIFSTGYAQLDETPIDFLDPGHGKTRQGYLWAARRPQGDTLYQWCDNRSHHCLKTLVPADFTGTLQCDGYQAYQTFIKSRQQLNQIEPNQQLTTIGCWAHARRRFNDALQAGEAPKHSGWILRQIQHLYRIESQLRQSRAGPALRQALRASQSRPHLHRLEKILNHWQQTNRHLPKSYMGRAIAYALGQWSTLTGYLRDGRFEIDNNLVENAIRPTKLGAKNWLFIGSREAGTHSAIIYTLIESARNRGLEPYAYLKELLTRLPAMTNHQIKDVTPRAWSEAQRQTQRTGS